ncbi:MAG: hypothetical protein HQK54_05375 [Oligoflexales bacterium]|nr:hypothetical protein [Oligoflexales bacterium]
MIENIKIFFFVFLVLNLTSCAALFKVQLSDVESAKARPVSIKVSETTVNLREISAIMKGVGKGVGSKSMEGAGKAVEYYTMFMQWGPKTGTPVYNEGYVRDMADRLSAECKSGRLTNITSIREAREYPVVKGEIVRIDGYCVNK